MARTQSLLALIALSILPRKSAREGGRIDQLLSSHAMPLTRIPVTTRQRKGRDSRFVNMQNHITETRIAPKSTRA